MAKPHAPRTIAIGDIHGCIHAWDALVAAVNPQPDDVVVPIGDFIDQGRDSAAVLDALLALEKRCKLVPLLGNHEEMLLASLESEEALRYWMQCGGTATLDSYYFGATVDVIPPDHIAFLRRCRNYYETDTHIFVHANYDPALPMDQQQMHMMLWGLLEDPRPHCSGKTVVVGHTEQRSGEVLDLGFVKCIDTFCYGGRWLTALCAETGQTWQYSRWGISREEFGE